MEFDNRTTSNSMQQFKAINKPPAIAPLGSHGTLQKKINNASAKLNANFDYRKQRQYIAAMRMGIETGSTAKLKAPDTLLGRVSSQNKEFNTKIPQKTTLEQK